MQPLAAVQTSSPEPRSAKITFKKVYQILLRVNGIFFFFFFFLPDQTFEAMFLVSLNFLCRVE